MAISKTGRTLGYIGLGFLSYLGFVSFNKSNTDSEIKRRELLKIFSGDKNKDIRQSINKMTGLEAQTFHNVITDYVLKDDPVPSGLQVQFDLIIKKYNIELDS